MTIQYFSPENWRKKIYELINLPSEKFEIIFVTPIKFKGNEVTELMVGYWFIGK